LIYPPVATFLAILFARNELNMQLLRYYIRTKIECSRPGLGWDSWNQRVGPYIMPTPFIYAYYAFKSGLPLFLFAQVITIVIGKKGAIGPLGDTLLIIDIISMIILILWGIIIIISFNETIMRHTITNNK
jgi:hypothetical protein